MNSFGSALTHPLAVVDNGNKTLPTARSTAARTQGGDRRTAEARVRGDLARLQSKQRSDLLCLSPHRPGSTLGAPSLEAPQRLQPTMGTGGEVECCHTSRGPSGQPFVRVRHPDRRPQPRPQHRAYSLVPSSQGPHRNPCIPPATSAESASAPGHRRQRQPRQEGSPRPAAAGSVCGWGAAHTSAGGGRGRPGATASWSVRRARLAIGGLPRGWRPQDHKSDSEVARCLAVCLQRAPPLSARLYNLTHNWP